MKVIVISQRVDRVSGYNEIRDAVDQNLIKFALTAGLFPLTIPNCLDSSFLSGTSEVSDFDTWINKINPQGIILSGGNDLDSEPARDITENQLLAYATKYKLPVLGICRGMQMMGLWGGVTLKKTTGHVGIRHTLIGEITREVNSYHRQVLSACPEKFSVLAHSKDGEIEAIRHKELTWEGWMWHPEREQPFQSADIERFKALFC